MCTELVLAFIYFVTIFLVNYFLFKLLKKKFGNYFLFVKSGNHFHELYPKRTKEPILLLDSISKKSKKYQNVLFVKWIVKYRGFINHWSYL